MGSRYKVCIRYRLSEIYWPKFRNHMGYGLHNAVATDFEDIGDRILQWGYQRDKLRAEVKQNFPQNSNPVAAHLPTLLSQHPVTNLRSTPKNTKSSKRNRPVQVHFKPLLPPLPMKYATFVVNVLLSGVFFGHI